MTRTARRFHAAALAFAVVALAACAPEVIVQPDITLTQVPHEDRASVPSPPEDPKPAVVWPLTGLDATEAKEANLERIAIAVKIDNSTGTNKAVPQAGLQHADIVFEEYMAKGGWTRFVAVFHSTYPSVVGNIRSLRPMDPYIFGSFRGALAFSGAAPGPLRDALALPGQAYIAEDLRNCRAAFYQKKGKWRPYSTYVHLNEVAKCAIPKGAKPASEQFTYAYPEETATATVAGTPVANIRLKFSRTQTQRWTWDAGSGRWLRFQGSDKHLQQDGKQISAANVVVLRARVRYKYGHDPETLLAGTTAGVGYVATGGQYMEIRWSKADRFDTFHLTTLDGVPVELMPGNTWVELLPSSGTGEVQELSFDSKKITTSR